MVPPGLGGARSDATMARPAPEVTCLTVGDPFVGSPKLDRIALIERNRDAYLPSKVSERAVHVVAWAPRRLIVSARRPPAGRRGAIADLLGWC